MVRQRENDVWSSVSLAYMAVNMASILKHRIDNCILIDNFWLLFYVSQPADAFKKVANCIN
jgi:hypothetical protein